MTDVRAITLSGFGDKAWKPFDDFRFAASSQVVAIAAGELQNVVGSFALAVLPGEHPTFVALVGLRRDTNLFVRPDGRWRGPYVPAALRAYPFRLVTVENDQLALGYDIGSGLLVNAGQGEPFFTADGKPAERVQQTLQFLLSVHQGHMVAARAAERLQAHCVLEPWPILVGEDESAVSVSGLLRVNEAQLNGLSADALVDLRDSGALGFAYAQLLSAANVRFLEKLDSVHAQEAEAISRQQGQVAESLGLMQDGSLQIDWDVVLKGGKS